MYLNWFLDGVKVILEPHKPDITHITFFRNVFSIEHTASAVFIAYWLVLPFREGYGMAMVITNFHHTKLYYLLNFSLEFIPKRSLKLANFSFDILIKLILIKREEGTSFKS